jgi:hypothetical protein
MIVNSIEIAPPAHFLRRQHPLLHALLLGYYSEKYTGQGSLVWVFRDFRFNVLLHCAVPELTRLERNTIQ